MSGFRFKLGRVLRVRRAAEEIQRARLAAAEDAAATSEHEARLRRASVDAARQVLGAEQGAERIDVARVLVALSASARVEDCAAEAHERARSDRSGAESERSVWRDARAGVLGLEKLQERDRARFRLEREAREERAIEDVAARRADEARRREERDRRST
ncbi:MAG: hypothetical protein JNK02_08200 [Planctomycetes bacterium]|nr:hypothetical protein [Planctomycetota bacterium]